MCGLSGISWCLVVSTEALLLLTCPALTAPVLDEYDLTSAYAITTDNTTTTWCHSEPTGEGDGISTRCECRPCWTGKTCLEYADYYAPRFLFHAATAVVPENITGVVYQAWATDADVGLTCPLGPGEWAEWGARGKSWRGGRRRGRSKPVWERLAEWDGASERGWRVNGWSGRMEWDGERDDWEERNDRSSERDLGVNEGVERDGRNGEGVERGGRRNGEGVERGGRRNGEGNESEAWRRKTGRSERVERRERTEWGGENMKKSGDEWGVEEEERESEWDLEKNMDRKSEWGKKKTDTDEWDKKKTDPDEWGKKKKDTDEWGKQKTDTAEWGKKKTDTDEWGKQKTDTDEWGKQKTDPDEWGKQKTDTDEWDKKKTDTDEWGKQKTDTDEWGKQKTDTDEFGTRKTELDEDGNGEGDADTDFDDWDDDDEWNSDEWGGEWGRARASWCPCGVVSYQLFAAPGDHRFWLHHTTGVLARNMSCPSPLTPGHTYTYKIMVQSLPKLGRIQDLQYDILDLKIYVSPDYVTITPPPWT